MNVIRSIINKLHIPASSAAPVCRTRKIADRFFECKVRRPNPMYCEHSLSSGDGFICNHKDRESFARK